MKYPLNQQESIVVELLFLQNQTIDQVAYEMRLSKSRIYELKRYALIKINQGNQEFKPTPESRAKLEKLLKRYEG